MRRCTTRLLALVVVSLTITPLLARAQDRRRRQTRSEPGERAEHRAAVDRQVDVQLRRRLGHVRFRELALQQPEGSGREENLSDQWFEGYVKPSLSGHYTLASGSEIYGKVSAVGERTYGSVPEAFGQDVSSFGPEDLSIGWRSGTSLTIGDNALDFTLGRTPYQLGHGFLLYDGAAEGGTRGGYWTNARKAFEFAAIGRFKPGPHTDRDVLSRQGRIAGERQRHAGSSASTTNTEPARTIRRRSARPT